MRLFLIAGLEPCTGDVQFPLRHPSERSKRAVYGFSLERGFYVDVTREGEARIYDASSPGYDEKSPLAGALRFLLRQGFFTPEEFAGAVALLGEPLPQGPRRVRRVVLIVRNFQAASTLR